MDHLVQVLEYLVKVAAVYAIPVIFAITLHEAAHGYVARHFGDLTAWRLGRVSLNPLRHIDPVGTIAVPLALLAAAKLLGGGALLFGWAKPVPVNYYALRHPRRDMMWVAAAGPLANLGMALAWALAMKLVSVLPQNYFTVPMTLIAEAGVSVNIVLMILNLLPILPLDGGRIAASLMPEPMARIYARSEPLGLVILLVLVSTDLLSVVLAPMVFASIGWIDSLFAL
ncbi:MAG: site-2 protease family protein [Burkholderiales bacterium]|nr:site-2 protease family protein [Burkholderiales bacterium]